MDQAQVFAQDHGEVCLARPGPAMGEDEPGPVGRRVDLGLGQIADEFGAMVQDLVGLQSRLGQADAGDLGPHRGPIDPVEIEQAHPAIVPGTLQVVVDEATRQGLGLGLGQIHGQEGDLVDGVDPAQGRVELDAVEDDEAPVHLGDVVPVEIAVALPHPAVPAALLDEPPQAGEVGLEPGTQGPDAPPLRRTDRPLGQIRNGVEQGGEDRIRGAVGTVRRGHRNGGVEGRQPLGDPIDDVRGHPAAAEQGALGKAAHHHRILQRLAQAGDLRGLRGAGDRYHRQVGVRGQATVEAQLLATEETSPLQGAEVQEAQVDRLLDLIGEIPREEDVGGMGLQVRQPLRRVWIGGRGLEPRDHQCVVRQRDRRHRIPPFHKLS